MRLLRCFVALAVMLALAIPSFAAPPDKKAKKKKNAPFRGTVVEVKAVDGKDEGVIIVKGVSGKKKDAPAADPQEKTFKVTAGTKIETRANKKKAIPATPVKLSAIEKGQTIVVVGKDDTADDIKVQAAKKKNKKKKKDAN